MCCDKSTTGGFETRPYGIPDRDLDEFILIGHGRTSRLQQGIYSIDLTHISAYHKPEISFAMAARHGVNSLDQR
jgi:hypothetical protein